MKNSISSKRPQILLLIFLAKFIKTTSNEYFNLCGAEISLDEIIKSINSETSNKSPNNDELTT